jgi:IclR family acetate operon transcriptional repressor
VVRAFEMIDVVAAHADVGVSLSDLARQCGMALSSCHRYAATLTELSVLERDNAGQFRLGVGLIALAGSYLEADRLRAVAHPYLVNIVAASGETSHLGRFANDRVIYVDKVECDKSVRLVSRIGSTCSLHCSAMGKSILATLPQADLDHHVAIAEPRTAFTLLGQDLRDEVARVGVQGWAIDDQENELGVRCVGAAILAATGTVVGALSVSGPADRFTMEDCQRIAPEIIHAARAIGARLG